MRSLALVSLVLVGCSFEGHTPGGDDKGPDQGRPDGGDVSAACGAAGDADHDGICDPVDDWPCGLAPAEPAVARSFDREPDLRTSLALQNIQLVDQRRLLTIPGGAPVFLSADYALTDTSCLGQGAPDAAGPAGCVAQIEYGFSPDRVGCLWDGHVSPQAGHRGHAVADLFAPVVSQPTLFEVRVRVGHNLGCTYQGATTWQGGVPPASDHTIAYVCVF